MLLLSSVFTRKPKAIACLYPTQIPAPDKNVEERARPRIGHMIALFARWELSASNSYYYPRHDMVSSGVGEEWVSAHAAATLLEAYPRFPASPPLVFMWDGNIEAYVSVYAVIEKVNASGCLCETIMVIGCW